MLQHAYLMRAVLEYQYSTCAWRISTCLISGVAQDLSPEQCYQYITYGHARTNSRALHKRLLWRVLYVRIALAMMQHPAPQDDKPQARA